MKFAFFTAIYIAITSPAFAEIPSYNIGAVKAECSEKWGVQYDMVAYCMKQRREGYDTFAKLDTRHSPTMDMPFSHCVTKWADQWDMVAYCANQQVEAVEKLSAALSNLPANVSGAIISQCAAKWGAQYDMVAYCASQLAEGWRAVNN